jgi:hypothetical protein
MEDEWKVTREGDAEWIQRHGGRSPWLSAGIFVVEGAILMHDGSPVRLISQMGPMWKVQGVMEGLRLVAESDLSQCPIVVGDTIVYMARPGVRAEGVVGRIEHGLHSIRDGPDVQVDDIVCISMKREMEMGDTWSLLRDRMEAALARHPVRSVTITGIDGTEFRSAEEFGEFLTGLVRGAVGVDVGIDVGLALRESVGGGYGRTTSHSTVTTGSRILSASLRNSRPRPTHFLRSATSSRSASREWKTRRTRRPC